MFFFKKKPEMVITAVNSITSVGHDAYLTAGAVYSDIAMLQESDDIFDRREPIIISRINGISDKEVENEFLNDVSLKCFDDLINNYFTEKIVNNLHLLLGVNSDNHPDKLVDFQWEQLKKTMMDKGLDKADKIFFSAFYCGNPSVFFALKKAEQILQENPNTTFIIGSSDSLLNYNIIEKLLEDRRIKSANYGRNHGLVPSHGAGFMVVESKENAIKKEKDILAEICGIGISSEPFPKSSGKPTRYSGLTEAINKSIKEYKLDKKKIGTVFSDMNGEYNRAKEWSFAAIRCLNEISYNLVHPADCFGSVGAASGSVLTNLASVYLSENWIEQDAMVVCSDDYGCCGSLILRKSN